MKTYKVELTINVQGLSIETQLKAKTYWCYLQETVSEQMAPLRNLRRYFTTTQKVDLPPHTIMCSCRKCEPSITTYYRKLRSL